eukprot:jgi/Ulvmu1/737/UM010_0110.1
MRSEESLSSQGQVGRRRSLQTASPQKQLTSAAVVTTASQLSYEVTKGTPHIEIRQHIDLSALSDLEFGGQRSNGSDAGMQGTLPTSIKSIRGNCSGVQPDYAQLDIDDSVPRLELREGQCLVITNGELLALQGSLLLDRVFLRIRRPETDPVPVMTPRTLVRVSGSEPGKLYMTNCTLQGDAMETAGEGPSRAMLISGRVYAEDCTFAHFGGIEAAIAPVTLHSAGASAAFAACTFAENTIGAAHGAVIAAHSTSAVRLQGCIFDGNTGAGFVLADADGDAAIFSDPESVRDLEHGFEIQDAVTVLPLTSSPSDVFLSGEDGWLRSTTQEATVALQNVGQIAEPPPPPSPTSATDGAAIAGIVAAAVAALLLMVAALLFWHHRQRGKETWGQESKELKVLSQQALAAVAGGMQRDRRDGDSAHARSHSASHSICDDGSAQQLRVSPRLTASPLISPRPMPTPPSKAYQLPPDLGPLAETFSFHTLSTRSHEALPPLKEGATTRERLTYIGRQLDLFGRRDLLLQKFRVLGENERRGGGQAVVQFVLAPQSNCQYAIKFFANRAAYNDEKQLYLTSELAQFMPTVLEFHDNDGACGDTIATDPFGNPMPPCFVMEKGESLSDRTKRCEHDLFTTIQIIGQVARCLSELHDRGWVHRDLKPANIMFLTRSDTWTLIDFGLAWRIGQPASIGYTLAYAAPEVITAKIAGVKRLVAEASVDAWALGVMAFELLTGAPAFNMFNMSLVEVWEQLQGVKLLPWEGERFTPQARRQLGKLRGPVLAMLNRNPALRMTCREFWQALHEVFSAHSSTNE